MIELIGWFGLMVHWIAIPSMAIMAVVFYKQKRTNGRLMLASGLSTILLAVFVGFIFTQTFETMEEAEQIITMAGPPLQWFIDDIVHSTGMILTLLGFGLVVVEDKRNV